MALELFSTSEIAFFDTMRFVAAASACVIIGTTPVVLVLSDTSWHQRVRLVGAALVSVAVAGSYLTNLGTVPAEQWWRVALITLGLVMHAVGTFALLRVRRRSREQPHHRRSET